MSTFARAWRPFRAFPFLALAACAGEEPAPTPRAFSADLAWAHLGQQLAFGPRVAGLPPHARQIQWMKSQLGFRADTVIVQRFTGRAGGRQLRFANVLARWRPETTERVLLVAHWDSPRHATRDPEDHLQRRPVPGANEGASGTAVLMELAQLFHEVPPEIGVDLLLTDGLERGENGEAGLGARHFLANLPAGYRPRWAVYVDRVGDPDLRIPMEGSSAASARAVVKRVWDVAREVGMDSVFVPRVGEPLAGEHRAFAAAGIPTAAVIDPEFGRGNELWRTTDDGIESVKRESLGKVGAVLSALVYREKVAP